MTDHTDALKRVLDFLDEWPTRFGPTISIVHEDDGPVELNVSDLYVLCDALKYDSDGVGPDMTPDTVVCKAPALPGEPKDEQYAISIPSVSYTGLVAGVSIKHISAEQGRKFLTGEIHLGFHEQLLWRTDESQPWERVW